MPELPGDTIRRWRGSINDRSTTSMNNDKQVMHLTSDLEEANKRIVELEGLLHAASSQPERAVASRECKSVPEPDREHFIIGIAMELAEMDGVEGDEKHRFIYEGGPIPEPWGEVWEKYIPQAKRLLDAAEALATKHQSGISSNATGQPNSNSAEFDGIKNAVSALQQAPLDPFYMSFGGDGLAAPQPGEPG
jgi:hypothetical protein